MTTALLETHNQGLLLSGVLDFVSTPLLWQQSQSFLMAASTPIQIDLHGLTASDSSGVALLIAWQRYASQLGKKIYFLNVPIKMQAIIKVSELENILSIQKGLEVNG